MLIEPGIDLPVMTYRLKPISFEPAMNSAMTKAIVSTRLPSRRRALWATVGTAGAGMGGLTEAMRKSATARAGYPSSRRRSVGVRGVVLLRLGDAQSHVGAAALVRVLVPAVGEVEVELVDAAATGGERVGGLDRV